MGEPYQDVADDDLILRDKLAAERTALANERTLLAYIRTALAFLVTGAAALKIYQSGWMVAAGWSFIVGAFVIVALGAWRFTCIKKACDRLR
jgi:putative membrane protein